MIGSSVGVGNDGKDTKDDFNKEYDEGEESSSKCYEQILSEEPKPYSLDEKPLTTETAAIIHIGMLPLYPSD